MARTIGTISHGTLRTEDLATAYIEELEAITLDSDAGLDKPENLPLRDEVANALGDLMDMWSDDGTFVLCDEGAEEALDAAAYLLDEFAPPFCYFGAHPGDASDFGYWPTDEVDMLRTVSDAGELPEDVTEAAETDGNCNVERAVVNDHGNVTVYRPRVVWDEVLSLV